ncbi:MAG: complex I NDUFA9 subunit family protein [Hyphomicrobium sp.]
MAAATDINCVTVFGGTGFLGSEIVMALAAAGLATRVAVRHPDKVRAQPVSGPGEIQPVYADVRDESSVALAIKGSDAVINCVGLYVENGAETFAAVHELGAINVAHQAAVFGIECLVHISGIGADLQSKSSYVHSRAKGELLVSDVFPHATILRPSAIFGPGDKFLNTLAATIRVSPVLPLFGQGHTKLQPVYVGDVAHAALKALQNPVSQGKIYELGGPRTYTYRALIELLLGNMKRQRLLLPLPFAIWKALSAAAAILPSPPITRAQVVLMERDNVVAKSALSFDELGIEPTALEDILPEYVL